MIVTSRQWQQCWMINSPLATDDYVPAHLWVSLSQIVITAGQIAKKQLLVLRHKMKVFKVKLMVWLCGFDKSYFLISLPDRFEQFQLASATSWTSRWIFLLFPEKQTHMLSNGRFIQSSSSQSQVFWQVTLLQTCLYTVMRVNIDQSSYRHIKLLTLCSDRLSLLADSSLCALRFSWNNKVIKLKQRN